MTSSAAVKVRRSAKDPSAATGKGTKNSKVQFLTVSNPSQWTSKECRLAVRSHVTRRQHELSRSILSQHSAVSDRDAAVLDAAADHPQAACSATRLSVTDLQGIEGGNSGQMTQPLVWQPGLSPESLSAPGTPLPMASFSNECSSSSVSQSRRPSVQDAKEQQQRRALEQNTPQPEPPAIAHCAYRNFQASQSGGSHTGVQAQEIASFATMSSFPTNEDARNLLFNSMLEYTVRAFAPLGWPALNINNEQAQIWEDCIVYHSQIEPAFRSVRLLFAAGHLTQQVQLLQPELTPWLHERAIAEIYTALTFEHRRLSEGIILAIGRLAFYESMFGDRRVAHEFHRPAQMRMIESRGGLDKLRYPEVVKYGMRWMDKVMAMQSHSHPLMEGGSVATQEQSLIALAMYLPAQYAALLSGQDPRDNVTCVQ